MIGYVTIGALGSERKLADGGWIGYGEKDAQGEGFMACHTAICPPYDGKPARAGNGIMVAYQAKSPDQVKAAHQGGMAHGGSDEGAPGFRPPEAKSGFYGAYLRDPTGNKLCVFCVA